MTAPGPNCTSKPPLRGPRCSISAHALAHDAGVSEVVGEMLMIGLVIILIGVFAAALGNFLPTARDPSVTILLTNDTHNISLWHKGGDWVKTEDLTVVISNDTTSRKYCANSTQRTECSLDFDMVSDNSHTAVFDLGSRINVTAGPLAGDETISLVTPGSRIFIGRVSV